ncbi:phosphoribosylglycinamide formyltransferase [Parvibaculaceae bacterium PLY_AMNH_Bact1]|nr:phosphoribosylglycinamide formyltransferase [Parvibaculaceae bacterium PLY_AMNH_Bact1]
MKLGILFSGRGTNLNALIDACGQETYPAEIAIAISNNPNAQGIAIAEAAGIPVQVINHKEFEDRDTFDAALDSTLKEAGVELVCNAGFMRILTSGFVKSWHNRQLNIHPSLLPAFKGLHVHDRVLESGVRLTGATVHFVRDEMDEGPIVAQVAVPVDPDDTVETLTARVLLAEHQIYPMAVRLVAEGKARVQGERVTIQGMPESKTGPLYVPALT